MGGDPLESATHPLDGGGGGGDDDTYWSTPDSILVHERELAEAKKAEAKKDRIDQCTMLLSTDLVHSRKHADRQRGIAMLKASLNNSGGGFPKERILYLLAVGYQRSEDYPMSMRYLDRCLKIAPNWRAALSLKKTIEEQRAREIEPICGEAPSLKKTIEEKFAQSSYNLSRFGDSWTGIGIAVGGVAAVGGIAAVYGTGVVGGMAAAVAVRRGLVVAATAGAILAAKKMAASPSGSSAMKN